MTTEQAKFWEEGKHLSAEYSRITHGLDNSLRPNQEIIAKMSKLLDLNQNYIRKCLDIYNFELP